jgi:hypothetical protein
MRRSNERGKFMIGGIVIFAEFQTWKRPCSYNAIPSTSIPISTYQYFAMQCKEGLIWGLHIPPTPSHNYCLGDTAYLQRKGKC